jgi:hypothetical protein
MFAVLLLILHVRRVYGELNDMGAKGLKKIQTKVLLAVLWKSN